METLQIVNFVLSLLVSIRQLYIVKNCDDSDALMSGNCITVEHFSMFFETVQTHCKIMTFSILAGQKMHFSTQHNSQKQKMLACSQVINFMS